MNEDQQKDTQTGQTGQKGQPANDAWQEVGRQFQVLGESLAAAFRASSQNEAYRVNLHAMQSGLKDMIKNIDKAIDEAMSSPEGQQARVEAQRAAESLRAAGEQTVQEIRPHLLSALKEVNDELHKFVNRMEGQNTPPSSDSKTND